jgi:hypothetical protein
MKVLKIYLKSEQTKLVGTGFDEKGRLVKLERVKPLVVPSKKNQRLPIVNKNTGETFLKQSDQYTKWKKITKPFWEAEYWKLHNTQVRLPIARCKVTIQFFFSDDRDKDCTNKAETIMDALVEHQILADDSFKVVSEVSLAGFLCRDRPRTEIYITILEPTDPGYDYDVSDPIKVAQQRKERRKETRNFKKSATPTD